METWSVGELLRNAQEIFKILYFIVRVIDKCFLNPDCSCISADTETVKKSVRAKAEMHLGLEIWVLRLLKALRDSCVLASYLLLVGQEKILGQ